MPAMAPPDNDEDEPDAELSDVADDIVDVIVLETLGELEVEIDADIVDKQHDRTL